MLLIKKIQFNLTMIAAIIGGFMFLSACNNPDVDTDFNKNWYFTKTLDSTLFQKVIASNTFSSNGWEKVSLPHSAHIEPLVIKGKQWQGDCFYQKSFLLPKSLKDKHVAIKFEGAMHSADVFLNGEKIKTHYGGYLPFYINISDRAKFGKKNNLVVKLNNEDNLNVPPGKPIDNLDFNYYSGLYRGVHLVIKNKTYISDPIGANRIAQGGILVSYSNVTNKQANVHVQVDVNNDYETEKNILTIVDLYSVNGKKLISDTTVNKNAKALKNNLFKHNVIVSNPNLWSPDKPYLYKLKVSVVENNQVIDHVEQKIGIRTFYFSAVDGFVLNGEKLKLNGTNRHQDYPYIGYAISDNANYRDAYKIKQAGFNFVRLSHYPHSVSFMQACDELGLLVMDAIPGWQFFGKEEFQKNSILDVRNMVRRDRNHACVVLWEASLNESSMTKHFMEEAHKAVHEELPITDVYTCGWLDAVYDVFIPARQHAKPPHYWNKYKKDKPIFIAEYGDWEYYAQNAGFNQKAFTDLKEELRTSRQLRGNGQRRLAQQALNYQEAHNNNQQGPSVGDANWLMFDYNRGYAPDIESSGISDLFRLPKFAYYFYQSQAGPNLDAGAEFGKPMIFIANYWNDSLYNDVKIYSNCDEVELFLNEQSIGRQMPDKNNYSTHLKHPPFTFSKVDYNEGRLKAVGYIKGKEVATYATTTPKKPVKVILEMDISGKPLQTGCNDVVFLYAKIVDENGIVIPLNNVMIDINLEGDISLVGQKQKETEAGIAGFVLKAGDLPGSIKISAIAKNMENALLEMIIQ
jgi:beta-galactosidase